MGVRGWYGAHALDQAVWILGSGIDIAHAPICHDVSHIPVSARGGCAKVRGSLQCAVISFPRLAQRPHA